jgi:hypothetical protein
MSDSLYTLIEKFKNSEVINTETGEITYLPVEFDENDFTREKVDRCVMYLRDLEGQVTACENLVDEILASIKSYDSKIRAYKTYLSFCLSASGQDKLQGNAFKIGTRKGSASVLINDEKKIPFQFLKTKTETTIDKKGIADLLKAGEKVDGAELVYGESTISISKGATK